LQQTYQESYLLVLDDAGQYEEQTHDRWRLVSAPQRYSCIGAKRQAGIEMLPPDCQGYLCWDDDDVYWPHAVASVAAALQQKAWAQCRLVYETAPDGALAITPAFGRNRSSAANPPEWGYGGCWAYRLKELRKLGGYLQHSQQCSDDRELAEKFLAGYGASADSTSNGNPWYWYNRDPGVNHLSNEGLNFWDIRAGLPLQEIAAPPVGWNGRNLYQSSVLADVQPRPF
jgi:hypothetical protein